MHILKVERLTSDLFRQFGQVIETRGDYFETNGGSARRYHRLAEPNCGQEDGRTIVSIFSVPAPTVPSSIAMLERHPISTQAFIPLAAGPTIYIVCDAEETPTPETIRAFIGHAGQGINYDVGVWHHPLISVNGGDYLVIDRAGPGDGFDQDYEEVDLEHMQIHLPDIAEITTKVG